jgi:hypothetical protein
MPDSLTVCGEAVVKRRINPHRSFVCSLVPNWLLCRKEVSHGAKLTYARLCQFAGQDGACFPSQQTIAREIGAAARSVRDYLSELETHGLIERERRGLRRTNLYHFLHHHWIDDGKGNSSVPERQNTAGPDRQNPAALDRQDPAVQERQNPADRRESFEENPKKRIPRKKERRATSSVDSGGTNGDFKPAATEDGTSTDASVGSAAVSGEAPAVPDPSSDASGPSGIPADSGPEGLPSVQEVTDFWQRKIREESFLVEFFHRCVRQMHPEITIRTRMEYDLENARRLVEACRAVITGANQPFAAIFQLILWYAEHQIESEQDAAINRMMPYLWEWREAETQEPTAKASRFLEAERQRLAQTFRQEKERKAVAEKARAERQRIEERSRFRKRCLTSFRNIDGDVQITGDDAALDVFADKLAPFKEKERETLGAFCQWYYERHLRNPRQTIVDFQSLVTRFPDFLARGKEPVPKAAEAKPEAPAAPANPVQIDAGVGPTDPPVPVPPDPAVEDLARRACAAALARPTPDDMAMKFAETVFERCGPADALPVLGPRIWAEHCRRSGLEVQVENGVFEWFKKEPYVARQYLSEHQAGSLVTAEAGKP